MKKRNDRGLYRRHGSAHWWVRYADRSGRICRESTGTTEKKLALEILAKKKVLVAENRHLEVRRTPRCTFFELCDRYWQTTGRHKRMHGLSNILTMFKKGIGNLPLSEITTERLERFLNGRMECDGVGAATRNRDLAVLSVLCSQAIKWGLLSQNPASTIRKLRENNARLHFLSRTEIDALISACGPELRKLVVMALHTGMRRGEIFNLTWEDVDFSNRLVNVVESKSGKKRAIPMDATVDGMLRALPSRFTKGLVFPSPVTGQKLTDLKKSFHSALDQAGITNFRFHDLRHTFASHLVMNGVDIKTVQELLGHASLTMTMRYAHLSADHRARAVSILDSVLQTGTKTDTVEKGGSAASL